MESGKFHSLVFSLCVLFVGSSALKGEDCRVCLENNEARVCEFLWPVQWKIVNDSNYCGNCPSTLEDCSKPGCIPLNGVLRPIITTNGMYPGPNVEVCKNDRVKITIQNLMSAGEAIGIHWHGQHMENQPYMDGIPMVTQCAIPAQTNFTYDFYPTTVGTHFWHSHSGVQRGDGLYGGFVVREKDDVHGSLYDFDQHILVINDWFERISAYRIHDLLPPDSILINGKGRKKGSGVLTPRAVFDVQSGNSYRFRVINAGSRCPWKVSIDDHRLTVIATDGNSVTPFETDVVGLFLAERLDFVVTADRATSSEKKDYKIRVISDVTSLCLTADLREVAFLRYNADDPSDPAPEFSDDIDDPPAGSATLNPIDPGQINSSPIIVLNSTAEQAFLDPADETYYLNCIGIPGVHTINGVSYQEARAPLLTQHQDVPTLCEETPEASKTTTDCGNGLICRCTHFMHWGLYENIEVVLFSSGSTHPMHMHGYFYSVIGAGKLPDGDITNEKVVEWDRQGLLDRQKKVNPPNKDVIALHDREYLIIRIYAKNPGWWFFHCHIDAHLEDGMAMVIRTGETKDLPEKPDNWPTCNSFPAAATSQPDLLSIVSSTDECHPLLISTIVGWVFVGILIIIIIVLLVRSC